MSRIILADRFLTGKNAGADRAVDALDLGITDGVVKLCPCLHSGQGRLCRDRVSRHKAVLLLVPHPPGRPRPDHPHIAKFLQRGTILQQGHALRQTVASSSPGWVCHRLQDFSRARKSHARAGAYSVSCSRSERRDKDKFAWLSKK
jgi:hypothetical protein